MLKWIAVFAMQSFRMLVLNQPVCTKKLRLWLNSVKEITKIMNNICINYTFAASFGKGKY
jgi:hypothetical protein